MSLRIWIIYAFLKLSIKKYLTDKKMNKNKFAINYEKIIYEIYLVLTVS